MRMATKPFTRDLWIDAKPAQVFAVLADLGQVQGWHPTVTSIKRLDESKMKEGTSWIETRTDAKGKPQVSTVRVTKFEPSTCLSINVAHKKVDLDCTFCLLDMKGGTRVEYSAVGKGKGIARFFPGKINEQMEKVDGDLLPRLCAQVEVATKAAKPVAKAARKAVAAATKAKKGK